VRAAQRGRQRALPDAQQGAAMSPAFQGALQAVGYLASTG